MTKQLRAQSPLWPADARCSRLLAIACTAIGCLQRDDVQLRISYDASSGAPDLHWLQVAVGARKSSWPELSAGDAVNVVLNPEGAPIQLTMNSQLTDQKHSWRAPDLVSGVGYAINLAIISDGKVLENHCERPCTLR